MTVDQPVPQELYTLGHSVHPWEKFLWLLQTNAIEILVDVRSTPASRFNPHFNRKRMEPALAESGIRYEYLGDQLGGRPADPSVYPADPQIYREHRVPDFSLVMQREWFQAGIDKLLAIAVQGRTLILCSEEDPAHCHRQVLIAAYLQPRWPQIAIRHLRGDGRVEN